MMERAKNSRGPWKWSACLPALFAVLLWPAGTARAQTASGTFKVVCIADRNASDLTHQKACIHSITQLRFGDDVTLAVEHAPNATFDDTGEPNPADLVLFLDGRPLPGTHARVGPGQTDEDDVTTTLLTYRVTRDLTTAAARQNWKEVLVAANSGQPLAISTGLENGPAAQSRESVEFIVFRAGRLVWWFVAAVAGLVVFFVVAARTGALRDKEPAGPEVTKPTERAFSLSRCQMALWTILTVYAYLFIWFLTGEYKATIPQSIVGLMGISLATFGTAAAVDAEKAQRNRATVCKSEGLFKDLTTSAAGASLHRLQFEIWTLALAVVFVVTVWQTLAMPNFDATLLALMGATSGAYAGLKLPEQKC